MKAFVKFNGFNKNQNKFDKRYADEPKKWFTNTPFFKSERSKVINPH